MNGRALARTLVAAIGLVLVAGVLAGGYVVKAGVSARQQPGGFEIAAMRALRGLVLRAHAGSATNPVPVSDEVIAEGLEHFADHCAVCHANDGSGNTEMGRGLYPRAPDMRLAATQNMTDAELFYIIENGIRFTGMPGWSTGTAAGETSSWHLVHFIRHLPHVTPEEMERMEALTPRSVQDVRQELEEEKFLQGANE